MLPLSILLLAAGTGGVAASPDFTCLGWGAAIPILGVICAISPDGFHEADEEIAEGAEAGGRIGKSLVESSVQDLETVGEFVVTHNAISVEYNFIRDVIDKGIGPATQDELQNVKEFGRATIGFVKQDINNAITILEWGYWLDFGSCLVSAATDEARYLAAKSMSDGHQMVRVDPDGAEKVISKCVTDKIKTMTEPMIFNITDPNEKVGADLSDLAFLLVPVVGGLKAGSEALAKTLGKDTGYDLAIAGAEDVSRLVEWDTTIPGEPVGKHFDTMEEALAVREKLKNDAPGPLTGSSEGGEWKKENCRACHSPDAAGINGKRDALEPRVVGLFDLCCKAVADVVADVVATNAEREGQQIADLELQVPEDTYTAPEAPVFELSRKIEYGEMLKEENLKPAPVYPIRDWSGWSFRSRANTLQSDLKSKNTAVIAWSPEMKMVTSSESLFKSLRKMFENGPSDPMFEKFGVRGLPKEEGDAIRGRLRIVSTDWLHKPDQELKTFQNFANEAMEHAKAVTAETLGAAPGSMPMDATVEFFWTGKAASAEAAAAQKGRVVLQPHADPGYFSFLSADTPGLVIVNRAVKPFTASRIKPMPDTYQVISNQHGAMATRYTTELTQTLHAVYGPEILAEGRVSMVVTTHPKTIKIESLI